MKKYILIFVIAIAMAGCNFSCKVETQEGTASYYHPSLHGNLTANGEVYDHSVMTAAHRYLPFGTCVEVTNKNNNREATVRINDRGPFINGRIIDLSGEAANRLDIDGLAPVTIRNVNC